MRRLLEIIGDCIAVAVLFFLLWVGLWASYIFG